MAEFIPSANKLSFDANSFEGSQQNTGKMHGFSQLSFKVDVNGELKPLIIKSYKDEDTTGRFKQVSYVVLSTDEALNPDNAAEDTSILDYALQDNEFLVKVERLGNEPSNQIGTLSKIFVKTHNNGLFVYTRDNEPRFIEVTFAQGKEPNVKGITFCSDDGEAPAWENPDGIRRGLSSINWNGGLFKVEPVSLETTMVDLTNFPMLSMKYKKDGTVFELNSNKIVKTYGNQTIDGLKTFVNQVQVNKEPTQDNHLVNKGFLGKFLSEALSPATDVSIITRGKPSAANGSNAQNFRQAGLKIYLADGRRLDPLYMETEILTASKTERKIVLTLNRQSDTDPQPTYKPRAELDAYSLQEGEFFATMEMGKQFATEEGYYCAAYEDSYYQNPWDSGNMITVATPLQYDKPVIGYKLTIHDFSLIITKITLYNTYYPGSYYSVQLTDNKTHSQEVENTSPKIREVLEFNFAPLNNVVTITGEQYITGAKTFSQNITLSAEPSEPNHVITKAFFDRLMPAEAPFNLDFLLKVENTTEQWLAFSQLKTMLANNTRLDIKYIENANQASVETPVAAVWSVVKDLSAAIVAPEKKTKEEIEAYQLQEGEFKGTVSFFKAVGNIAPYSTVLNPWASYCGSITKGTYEGFYGFSIKGLPSNVASIQFIVGCQDSYAYEFTRCTGVFTVNGSTSEVEYTGSMNNGDVVILKNAAGAPFVTIDGEQAITGAKTFTKAPKSMVEAAADEELVTLGQLRDVGVIPDTSTPLDLEFTIGIVGDRGYPWQAFSEMKLLIGSRKRLDCKYIESTIYSNATAAKMVMSLNANPSSVVPVPERKAKSFFDTYQLQEGEFFAELVYAPGLGPCRMHTSTQQTCPWDAYLIQSHTTDKEDLIVKITILGFTNRITAVEFFAGDKYNSYNYHPKKFFLDYVAGGVANKRAYSEDIPIDQSKMVVRFKTIANKEYVDLTTEQTITGKKTFSTLPQSTATPTDGSDFVTKAYVDSKGGVSPSELPEHEVIVYAKTAASGKIELSGLSLEMEGGSPVDVIYYEQHDSYRNLKEPLRVVFSTRADRKYSAYSGTHKYAGAAALPKKEFDAYELKDGEFFGTYTPHNLLNTDNGAVFADNSYNLIFNKLLINSTAVNERFALCKFAFKAKLLAITKGVITVRNGTGYSDATLKLASIVNGTLKEGEYVTSNAAVNMDCTFGCEAPVIYEDFYVDTVSNQFISGVKGFVDCPQYHDKKPMIINPGNNLVTYNNLASSIGISIPEKQLIHLPCSATQRKTNAGGSKWTYSWSITVNFHSFTPAFIDPMTGKITPLYILYYCSDGRAVLTTTTPQNPYVAADVTSKTASEMDSYKLKGGEYLCRLYWGTANRTDTSNLTEDYLKSNPGNGSKVLSLFTQGGSAWWEYTTGQTSDASTAPSPMASTKVEFYNTPAIRYVKCASSSPSRNTISLSLRGLAEELESSQTISAKYDSNNFQSFGYNYYPNYAMNYPTTPVQLMNVAYILGDLQKTIADLTARIEALENTAP